MTKALINIESDCLSTAWALAFEALWQHGEIQPLVVSVTSTTGGPPIEDPTIRAELDTLLVEKGKSPSDTVASTIFPWSLWNQALPAEALYQRYLRVYPRLHRSSTSNRYGMYFHRMIAFGSEPTPKNQLDHVIRTRQGGNLRRSALQVAIMDPGRDQTNQRQRGFPCLQHVIFTPVAGSGLAVTGIYGTQYITEKGYGNYLGLYNLGRFMAHEMGLHLTKMTCFAATAKLSGGLHKKDLVALHESLHGHTSTLTAENPIQTLLEH